MKTINLFSLIIICCLLQFFYCGGGADIGNPSSGFESFYFKNISGVVKNSNNQNAYDARVILGHYSDEFIIGSYTDTIVQDGITTIITSKLFDTVYTDVNGKFEFKHVLNGMYVIVAENGSERCLTKISESIENPSIQLKLGVPGKIVIQPYSRYDTTKTHFISSRIAGTPYSSFVDSTGKILFNSVPSGNFDIVLYKSDSTREVISSLTMNASSNITLKVGPSLPPSYSTVISDVREWNGRPYVMRFGVWNDSLPHVDSQVYDLYIQFSHTMDTYATSNALKVRSSNGTIQIDGINWQGADLAYIRLCVKDSTGLCTRTLLPSTQPWIVDIDTTAMSSFGIRMAWPEALVVENLTSK